MKTTKIVIDTNLWIGYFMGKHVKNYLDQILANVQIDLLMSEKSLAELTSVLSRPKF
jgi:putative PIN family toxin of toxin-antitoxin system